jgi:hypothetical protein
MEMRRSKGSLRASAQARAQRRTLTQGTPRLFAAGEDAGQHAVLSHGEGAGGNSS